MTPREPLEPQASSNYRKYIGLGVQLAATLLFGLFAGFYIDKKKGTLPWFTLAGAALGFLAGFYNLLKDLKDKK